LILASLKTRWSGSLREDEDLEALEEDALGDAPRVLALFFADRREEAGADETTESRASSMGRMKSSGVESWLGCLGRLKSLTIGMEFRSGWKDPLQTSVVGQKIGEDTLMFLFFLFFRRSSAVFAPTGWGG
jgi:hypothetical protein